MDCDIPGKRWMSADNQREAGGSRGRSPSGATRVESSGDTVPGTVKADTKSRSSLCGAQRSKERRFLASVRPKDAR
jgi:hypothetical protein